MDLPGTKLDREEVTGGALRPATTRADADGDGDQTVDLPGDVESATSDELWLASSCRMSRAKKAE